MRTSDGDKLLRRGPRIEDRGWRFGRVVFVVFVCTTLLAQEDQKPRPPVRNEHGLLQINRQYYDMAATTGGDIYFWAPGEFATAKLRVPIEREPVVLSYGTVDSK